MEIGFLRALVVANPSIENSLQVLLDRAQRAARGDVATEPDSLSRLSGVRVELRRPMPRMFERRRFLGYLTLMGTLCAGGLLFICVGVGGDRDDSRSGSRLPDTQSDSSAKYSDRLNTQSDPSVPRDASPYSGHLNAHGDPSVPRDASPSVSPSSPVLGPPSREPLQIAMGFFKLATILFSVVIFGAVLLTLTAGVLIKLWHLIRAVLNPVPSLKAPDPLVLSPLNELDRFAVRSAFRLRSSYRVQLGLAIVVAAIIAAAFVWSLVMVAVQRLSYATVFGGSGIGATVTAIRWQPFERITRARDLAEQADALAVGLRLRMTTIARIVDPLARHDAEWNAVTDYTSEALRASQVTADSRNDRIARRQTSRKRKDRTV